MRDPDQEWWQDPQHRCRVCDAPILDDDDGRCSGCIDEGREPRG